MDEQRLQRYYEILVGFYGKEEADVKIEKKARQLMDENDVSYKNARNGAIMILCKLLEFIRK